MSRCARPEVKNPQYSNESVDRGSALIPVPLVPLVSFVYVWNEPPQTDAPDGKGLGVFSPADPAHRCPRRPVLTAFRQRSRCLCAESLVWSTRVLYGPLDPRPWRYSLARKADQRMGQVGRFCQLCSQGLFSNSAK